MEQEYFGWNQKGDERDLSRMSDKKHLVNGRFSASAKTQEENTVSDVKATRTAHRSKDSRQTKSRVTQPSVQSMFTQLRTQHDDKQRCRSCRQL